jgi:hypothetical protein
MSFITDLTRLATAKNNIANAIASKGVAVPSSTLISGMPALIGSIPQFKSAHGSTTSNGAVLTFDFAPKIFFGFWRRTDNTSRWISVMWAVGYSSYTGTEGYIVHESTDPRHLAWVPVVSGNTLTLNSLGGTGTLFWAAAGY